MNPIISHFSALNYLDKCARTAALRWNNSMPKPLTGPAPTDWACTKGQLRIFDLSRFERPGAPLDVLVPSNFHNYVPKGFKFHSSGAPLPDNSLLSADEGVLIASPALVFLQLCRELPVERCIKLGSFICGVYSPEPSVRSGVVDREQLSTTEELMSYLVKGSALYGSRRAAEALPWILENAASPQETELAMPFYLPVYMGGKGFVAPTMNYKVELTPKERGLFSKKEFRIDVCWPDQKVGLEYNSYAEHSDEHKIGEDEQRRLYLREKGYHVELVTKQQLDDPTQIGILARMLEEHGVPRLI